MGRPAALSRDLIVDAATRLVGEHGAGALSARRLGEALGCDPSALYRHFDNMVDLEREVGDRFLAAVDVRRHRGDGWRDTVHRICVGLRTVQLQQPRLAALVQWAPTRMVHEVRITDALLRELRGAGFADAAAAQAYHALIELTVGSAAIDAPLSAEPASTRSRTYREWRKAYERLDAADHPDVVALAPHLYLGSADERFEQALDLLLDGLSARLAGAASQ